MNLEIKNNDYTFSSAGRWILAMRGGGVFNLGSDVTVRELGLSLGLGNQYDNRPVMIGRYTVVSLPFIIIVIQNNMPIPLNAACVKYTM